ncbi:hypothetical protein C8J56DRAFT_951659 [Mycena floridula]|nr:hypothetical protein C8J56DRAFT_951659 [Mycena floridula]
MLPKVLPPPFKVPGKETLKTWDFSKKDESTQLAYITPEILVRFSHREFTEIHGFIILDFIEAPSRSAKDDEPLDMSHYNIFPWGPSKGHDCAPQGPHNRQYLVPVATYDQIVVYAQGAVVGKADLPPWRQRAQASLEDTMKAAAIKDPRVLKFLQIEWALRLSGATEQLERVYKDHVHRYGGSLEALKARV